MSAATVIPALMVGGGLLSASSQIQAGNAQSRMATTVAGQYNQNADLADIAAANAVAGGQRGATEALRQNKMLQSKQIAIAAAQGASTSEKNIADLISNTASQGEYEALSALYEGNTKSDALKNEAIGLRNKATMTRYEGKQARKAANIGAISSLIGSGATAGSFYAKYNSKSPTDLTAKAEL
ncbi:MAG: hypothetical protein WCJ58_01060 [bacterium]